MPQKLQIHPYRERGVSETTEGNQGVVGAGGDDDDGPATTIPFPGGLGPGKVNRWIRAPSRYSSKAPFPLPIGSRRDDLERIGYPLFP